jgi:isocitrate dehydrogenase (NAD+)
MSKTIAVIPGDGIGPEIMTATLRVLDALECGLSYDTVEAGTIALEKQGDLLPTATLKAIAKHQVALKGPLTTPVGGGFTSINVTLRRHFDLYANVRPAISFPGTKARYENIDIITVRENTEGAYLAEGQTISEDGEVATSMIRNTRKGSARIVRYAFEMAVKKGRKKVTAVHKANIIKTASGLFLNVAREIAKEYPQIEFNEMIVDNACMQLVMRPEQFDVIVTTNLFGDILSLVWRRATTLVSTRRSSKPCTAPRRISPARALPIPARCCWLRQTCSITSAWSRKAPSCARRSATRWRTIVIM